MKKLLFIFLIVLIFDLGAMKRSPECMSINELSSLDSSLACYICWLDLDDHSEDDFIVKFIDCGHMFHSKCLDSISECPACNKYPED